ncbi:MAG TPA: glycerate kinase [Jiangellaceae bacterium]|nr:glycerate kinase [Jiangellaceae bacterium]
MRVLVAPDKFAGTLTAVEAAEAIAKGWRRTVPGDDVVTAPMADGGPGFVDVLHAATGGDLLAVTVRGPFEARVPATLLLVGSRAFVESAQACGIALLPRQGSAPVPGTVEDASTFGVGELVAEALAAGATEVVVGLGGTGTNDGGAGMLAALGATSEPAGALTAGVTGLNQLQSVDVDPARDRLSGVDLVAATDVDNPLLGLRGATNVFGPQKGVAADRLIEVDGALTRFAHLAGRGPADARGAGAAGGLGYGLMLLGGRREPGFAAVADAVGVAEAIRTAELVLTGEGKLDWQSMSGKVVSGIAALAAPAMRPCVVIAGSVQVGLRELRANGIEAAYSVVDVVGADAAFGEPAESLAKVAARVARTWSRR